MTILDIYTLLHADSYILVDFYTDEEVDCVTKEQVAAVYGYAKVYGKAVVGGGAEICGFAEAYGNAYIKGRGCFRDGDIK